MKSASSDILGEVGRVWVPQACRTFTPSEVQGKVGFKLRVLKSILKQSRHDNCLSETLSGLSCCSRC